MLAEHVLPESQCGFRSGRGCVDMIFCGRQLIEKAIEHIRKAYDSVQCAASWRFIANFGVPPYLLSVICSLHNGMKAEVTVDSQVAPDFKVSNGLHQGCVMAPTLLNLYFGLVIEQWRVKCSEFGVDVFYKLGGKLVGQRSIGVHVHQE